MENQKNNSHFPKEENQQNLIRTLDSYSTAVFERLYGFMEDGNVLIKGEGGLPPVGIERSAASFGEPWATLQGIDIVQYRFEEKIAVADFRISFMMSDQRAFGSGMEVAVYQCQRDGQTEQSIVFDGKATAHLDHLLHQQQTAVAEKFLQQLAQKGYIPYLPYITF